MEEIHVVGHAALAISHGMSVLRKYEGLGWIALRIGEELTRAAVHIAVDVGIGTINGALEHDGTGGVELLDCRAGGGKVLPIPCLIGHRPDDDRGVNTSRGDLPDVSLHMGNHPLRLLSERLRSVAHTVRLNIRLGTDIETVDVAELVEVGIIGVVTGADSIHIELLSQLHVLQHPLARHDASGIGVGVVAIGALDEDRLAIDLEQSVLDPDVSETDIEAGHLGELPVDEALDLELVEIGGLGGPGSDTGDNGSDGVDIEAR